MPIYVWICPHCQARIEKPREIEDVYKPVDCDCGGFVDPKKDKIIEGGINVTFAQESLKGRM